MKTKILTKFLFLPAAFALCLPALNTRAQSSQGESSSTDPRNAPPPASDPLKPAPTKRKNKDKDTSTTDQPTSNTPDQPTWDPLRADKDIEVGEFYLKKGDLDAAIDRFQDAAAAKPGYAVPYRYLGEAQEKKGQKREAIKSYKRYLDMYPHAEDAAKIQKKLDKLNNEVDKKDKSGKSAG